MAHKLAHSFKSFWTIEEDKEEQSLLATEKPCKNSKAVAIFIPSLTNFFTDKKEKHLKQKIQRFLKFV